jgi:hypothetical protein
LQLFQKSPPASSQRSEAIVSFPNRIPQPMYKFRSYDRLHSSLLRSSFILIALFASFNDNRVIAAPESKTASQEKIAAKQWRKEAANRRRRIIFNNDGAETAVKMTRPSVQDFLDLRTSALPGSQVDSVFYCTRSSGFGVFTHLTKVGQVFTCKEGRYADNQTEAFAQAGIDPLNVIIDFCKKHQLEVFWSMRMNDTHDGSKTDSKTSTRSIYWGRPTSDLNMVLGPRLITHFRKCVTSHFATSKKSAKTTILTALNSTFFATRSSSRPMRKVNPRPTPNVRQ